MFAVSIYQNSCPSDVICADYKKLCTVQHHHVRIVKHFVVLSFLQWKCLKYKLNMQMISTSQGTIVFGLTIKHKINCQFCGGDVGGGGWDFFLWYLYNKMMKSIFICKLEQIKSVLW